MAADPRGLQRPARDLVLLAVWLAGLAAAAWALPLAPADREAPWAARTGDLQLRGGVWPARLGLNRLTLNWSGPSGPSDGSAEVEALFLPVGGGGVTAQRTLTWDAAAGVYSAGSFALTRTGPWQMLVTVQRPGQPAEYASLDWTVGDDGALWLDGEPRPAGAVLAGWANRWGAWALAGLAAAAVAIWAWGWFLRRAPASVA